MPKAFPLLVRLQAFLFGQNLSFVIYFEFCHNLSYITTWVLSQLDFFEFGQILSLGFKFLNFVTLWVLGLSPFEFMSFITICVFEFHHNLSFQFHQNLSFWIVISWVFEGHHNLSFITIWVFDRIWVFEFCHSLSYVIIWVLKFCHKYCFVKYEALQATISSHSVELNFAPWLDKISELSLVPNRR